jgi:hypothetical protein
MGSYFVYLEYWNTFFEGQGQEAVEFNVCCDYELDYSGAD